MILYKKIGLLVLILISFSFSAIAQKDVIKGVVKDNQGEAIIGASVKVDGGSAGTVTDMDGKYSIEVDHSVKQLRFSFVGYETKVVNINNRTVINVVINESEKILDEVVAIGYAKVKKRDLTGAISSVSGKELAAAPVMTAAQALQGKVPGVNIVTASGAPGSSVNVTLRGGTSITQSNTPLYIVDGFVMDDALSNININDIESIDVLKDASATAIYGARASNGIILITTKSAKKGKTVVSYNNYFSFDTLSKKLKMMSNAEEYVNYQYELAELQGKTSVWSNVFDNGYATDNSDFYTGAYDRISERYAGASTIDWQKEIFGGSALTQNHNINIATGSDKTQVLLSYNYNGQDGLLANHSAVNNTFRVKVNSELYKGVRLDANSMFTSKKVKGGGAYSGMKSVLLQPIIGGTLFTQDKLLNTQTYPDYSGLDSGYDTSNPLVQNEASTSEKNTRLMTANAGIEFDFLKHFTWRTAGSYSCSNTESSSFADENSTSYLMDPTNTGINGGLSHSESYSYQITNTLNYNQTFAKKHKVSALLGQEYNYSESKGYSMTLIKFPYPNYGLDDISNATVSDKSSSHSHSSISSVFARGNYAYEDRYLLSASIRADGSSKFAEGHRWGVFPAFSGAWRISEEGFWKNSPIANTVNNLKLRAGYGATGNCNISNYLYRTSVSETDYPIDSNEGNAVYVPSTTLGNSNLKWETLHSTNIGLDMSLFNSRVIFTAEWYNNQVNDLLMQCSIPVSTGYSYQYQNIGKIRNRGLEFTFNTINIQTKDFRWTTDLNFSFNKSKVLALENGETEKTFSEGGNRSGCVTYYAVVGKSLGAMYGYKYQGVYTTDDFTEDSSGNLTLKDGIVKPYSGTPAPGDIKFATDNDDKTQFTRQKTKIGDGTPDCIGGLNNTFSYHGFDMSVFMKFCIGNDVYNATNQSMSPYALFQNAPKNFGDNYYHLIDPTTGKKATSLSRIQELNTNESSRLWSLGTTNSSYITYPSSYYVEDGSYLRIAQITLGYSFPKKWIAPAKISNLRIYFTANNLATITGYSGYDPEVSAANDNVICTPGYDSSTYPRSRSYVLGINLTF